MAIQFIVLETCEFFVLFFSWGNYILQCLLDHFYDRFFPFVSCCLFVCFFVLFLFVLFVLLLSISYLSEMVFGFFFFAFFCGGKYILQCLLDHFYDRFFPFVTCCLFVCCFLFLFFFLFFFCSFCFVVEHIIFDWNVFFLFCFFIFPFLTSVVHSISNHSFNNFWYCDRC